MSKSNQCVVLTTVNSATDVSTRRVAVEKPLWKELAKLADRNGHSQAMPGQWDADESATMAAALRQALGAQPRTEPFGGRFAGCVHLARPPVELVDGLPKVVAENLAVARSVVSLFELKKCVQLTYGYP